MRSVGAFEAKTHLSRLLDLVEKGEHVEITRHGRVIAHLVRPRPEHDPKAVAAAIERIKAFGRRKKSGHASVKKLIEDGRS